MIKKRIVSIHFQPFIMINLRSRAAKFGHEYLVAQPLRSPDIGRTIGKF